MFERLAQKVLGQVLSKFFTEESLEKNKIYSSTQLGVWSGYISLQNLVLKTDVVNSKLRGKGLPFEVVHCSFRQIEITIPWAKLSSVVSSSSPSPPQINDDSVVIIVADGVHILASTNFDFDDISLRKDQVQKRRKALKTPFCERDSNGGDSQAQGFAKMVKKRIKDGLLQEFANIAHFHLRDVHIRLEDIESDPQQPYAFGLTLESMNLQHDEDAKVTPEIIAKVAQLNHLAVYWNAIDYGDNLPVENSVLSQTCRDDSEKFARCLSFCIARRASVIASPSRNSYIPTHTYLLLPVDGTLHGRLSTQPSDLSVQPALEAEVFIDPVCAQIRDFQCVQILRLAGEYKNHKYVKRYRQFRPLVSVKEDPKAWWLYAARAIRYQLRETYLRWSWSRFLDIYQLRKRYLYLYERKILHSDEDDDLYNIDLINTSQQQPRGALTALQHVSPTKDAAPDAGAGPSRSSLEKKPLTNEEKVELQQMDDGLYGDLPISTVLLFRAVVNSRLGAIRSSNNDPKRSRWWAPAMASAIVEDSEAKQELERLLKFLDRPNAESTEVGKSDEVAVSIAVRFEELRIALLSPHSATIGESPIRQIYEKFLDLCIFDLRCGYSLMGDYDTKEFRVSISSVLGTEIRADKSHHIIAKQIDTEKKDLNVSRDTSMKEQNEPLVLFTQRQSPPKASGRDVRLVVFVNAIELAFTPECQWISHAQSILEQVKKAPNVADFWANLSLAYVNSLTLGRLGFIVKAESTAYEHKNLDADITIKCPVLRFGDGKGNHLIADLGILNFKTEKLAVVSGKTTMELLEIGVQENMAGDNSIEHVVARVDDASVVASVSGKAWSSRLQLDTPPSSKWRSEKHFTFTSALSVDSRVNGNRSFGGGGSINFDESFARVNITDDPKGSPSDSWSYLFYDVFALKLQTGKITLCGESEVFDITSGIEISTILKKSVLPADHTICKLKAHTIIDRLNIEVNEKVIMVVGNTLKTWKSICRPQSSTANAEVTSIDIHSDKYAVKMASDFSSAGEEQLAMDEASFSEIDENEFFDANTTNDSFAGESSALWFEENWISDAESIIDGESRHSRRRRRAHSISDVSSGSDQSTKDSTIESSKPRKAQQHSNAYLSAENLARLEEGVGEDESLAESAIELDDGSFHSVMSSAGQQEVLKELEDDIEKVEKKIQRLSTQLEGSNVGLIEFTKRASSENLKDRKFIKLELNRARAELNGLRSIRDDLSALLSDRPNFNGEEQRNDMDLELENASRLNIQAKNAKALLTAKRRRESTLRSNSSHNLTQSLNREIFQGSFLVQHFQVTLHVPGLEQSVQKDASYNSSFEFVATETGLAVFRQAQDTKIYFSSDQVSFALRDKVNSTAPSRVLFSGGSADTLLPSHFPHLISRSMEEKFLRGSLHFGKRKPVDPNSHLSRLSKIRLVIGDVEILPSRPILASLRHFLQISRPQKESSLSENVGPSLVKDHGSNRRDEDILNGERSDGDKASKYLDIAVRLSSVRIALSRGSKIVGAIAATEAALRVIQIKSPLRDKLQVESKCTNFQALEISSLQAGRGSEIAGRRDPYNNLIQVRLRNEVVHPNESGGWVVGLDSTINSNGHNLILPFFVRNAHLGVKINPVSLVAAPQALSDLIESFKETKSLLSIKKAPPVSHESTLGQKTKIGSVLQRLSEKYRLRWRIDVSIKRVSINFPEKKKEDWNFTDDVESKIMMAFSITSCLQASVRGQLAIQMALTEIAVLRSSNDWPILEPFSVLCDACVETDPCKQNSDIIRKDTLENHQLKLNAGSSLSEIAAVLQRYGWDKTSLHHTEGAQFGLIAKATPLKANLSALIIGLLVEVASSFRTSRMKSTERVSASPTSYEQDICSEKPENKCIGFHFVLEEVELQLLHEAESKPIASAESLFSLSITDARIDYEKGEQVAASVLIRNASVFDLSSSRGVRILGENSGSHDHENPYFVRVKLYMDKHLDGPDTTRLEINWGRIQCLVMPSFLRSILALKDGVESTLRSSSSKTRNQNKKGLLDKLLALKDNVNLIVSTNADAFELILSSKDIAEYVKNSGMHPIGAVTLRWKASLTLAVALDTLKGSSVPWLTLNLDDKLTDPEDTVLFKDFVNRYLSQSSGLLAGSDEIGQQLMNAFTGRIGLFISNFQVIRTNIVSDVLKPRQKNVSHESTNRVYFTVTPPDAGEQRVTNSIDLDVVYRAVGTSMVDIASDETSPPHTEISQLLQVKAKFVDVLLYISKSQGGFTESISTTIKPILEMLKKKKDKRRTVDDQEPPRFSTRISSRRGSSLSFIDLMKSSSSTCTIQLEGFQITCVPGGATLLNESPIIKFKLNGFSSGIAGVPIPLSQKFSSRGGMRSRSSSQNLLASAAIDVEHLTVAGWMICQITGHYHNRRLVAWEPFIEPWQADIRFGLDAVETLRLSPTHTIGRVELRSPPQSASFHSSESKGDRLRDFGRLFRAPFQSSTSSRQTSTERMFISHADFCYLMLASTSRSTILSALYPTVESTCDQESLLFSRLPAREKIEWLRGFGFPGRENDDSYSLSVALSDSKPLNINLTGALLENVLGYLKSVKANSFRTVAPHWIRNDTGMTIRFQEVLDNERAKRGEESVRFVLEKGGEVPLTLKRSLSQTCDPHRAYIYLELGSFEETAGRIKLGDFDVSNGALPSTFCFKAAAKIPVDTVGVHRYPLDHNVDARNESSKSKSDSRTLGWIIVRVALRGGAKVVSVESPFSLKSTADADIICEVRRFNGSSLVWKCLVPRLVWSDVESRTGQKGLVSIPADVVPYLHDGSHTLSVKAIPRALSAKQNVKPSSFNDIRGTLVSIPPPFSPQSYGRGFIGEKEVQLESFDPDEGGDTFEQVNLSVCSCRLGSFSGVRAAAEVPEQRMLVFRSPLAIRNCLALPISIQVRLKPNQVGERNVQDDWEDLGVLDCGQFVNWTGAKSIDRVQLRVRFVGTDGDNSRRFPGWSSAVFIPSHDSSIREMSRPTGQETKTFAQMKVVDAENIPLHLSVAFDGEIGDGLSQPGMDENIRMFSQSLSVGTRAVSIFVPYWIVDGSNQDLEFFSGAAVAGQLDKAYKFNAKSNGQSKRGATLGLAELLDNDNFLHLPSTRSFDVLMVGYESSTRLTVRKRLARQNRNSLIKSTSPWSDPIPLQAGQKSRYDIMVLTPQLEQEETTSDSEDIQAFDRFVLRAKIVVAPERFGGLLGTKLIHVVNRYAIMNETGRDIEIFADYSRGRFIQIRATGTPQPFHFDDSKPIRFRFKEFGWTWSGKFSIRITRPELTMRLRHKMKGQTIIVAVELLEKKNGSTNVLVFRQSSHPPFRLENHTMFPLHYGQSSASLGSEDSEVDSMLLPYQSADFAWDEPELRRRVLVVKAMDRVDLPEGFTLGRFQLDKLAPGASLKVEGTLFAGEIVADGPTRVMRITDASMPSLSSARQDELDHFQHRPESTPSLRFFIMVKLTHGVGISIVDWSPRELLYARVEDIQLEKKIDTSFDAVSISIGKIKLNNQLWVTPYPVLLRMGRRNDSQHPIRRRNRRQNAINISWRRSLNTHGGYGNLTLLERVEIASEPVFVNVDGQLADLLFRMVKQILHGFALNTDRMDVIPTRDEELKEVLDLKLEATDEPLATKKAYSPYQQGSDGDLLTTAAVAAKMQAQPLPFVKVLSNRMRASRSPSSRKDSSVEMTKTQHKLYIEELRVSAARADLSWSGPLPGLVSSILFRALTFERLPIRLRPYSSIHAYGSVKDHMQSLKSHYVSFWRILDLLTGVVYNPTFLFRAVVYTGRETFASIFDSWGNDADRIAKTLTSISQPEIEFQPQYDDLVTNHELSTSTQVGRAIMGPFAKSGAALFSASSLLANLLSSFLRFSTQGSRRLATQGLVRSRNPRLFTQLDGRDLLVEYVEGENAGKALLSRVRMGMHLGEGYIFHSEGVRQLKMKPQHAADVDPSPLIAMITSERLLLLNGKLDGDFCAVVWEVMFNNIVHLEFRQANDLAVTNSLDEVIVWYLSEVIPTESTFEEKNTAYARAFIAGVNVLHSVSIFVPQHIGLQLISKMSLMDDLVEEDFSSMVGNSKIKQD